MTGSAHTFLFMDLVGFTALTAEHGDDSAAEVALQLYAYVRELLPEHDGEEIKTIGDAMMIRCADPRRGVELGLRISEQLGEDHEFPPVRIGLHTGSAVSRGGDWYGNAVNVASRLCSAAGGGEVLVSDATRDAAGSSRHFDFGERRLHWLKNVPEPVAARPVSRCEQPAPRQAMRRLAAFKARTLPAGLQLRHSQVAG
jgi:adenylate cyclase